MEPGSYLKEENISKTVIRKIRTKFVEDMNPQLLLDVFLGEDYITKTQERDIREQSTTSDKNRGILDMVSCKGVKGYNAFKKFLRKSRQENLADYIDIIEAEVRQADKSNEKATVLNQETGYHCFICNYSCDNLELLEMHTKTPEHLDMTAQQDSFADKFTDENTEPETFANLPNCNTLRITNSSYCNLCRITFTSTSHASSHYNGKPHQKRQSQFEASQQQTAASINVDSFHPLQSQPPVDEPSDQADSQIDISLESYDTTLNPEEKSTTQADRRCDVCDVQFSGPENAKQHYSSDKHKKKELQLQKQRKGEVLPLECSVCKCSFTGQESAESHFSSLKHKKKANTDSESLPFVTNTDTSISPCSAVPDNSKLECNICQVRFSGPDNANQHYNSPKHKKKEQKYQNEKEGEILPLSCDLCKCTFTGQEHAKSHFDGAKHKKKKRENENAAGFPLHCKVCLCSFSGQENAREHFNSLKHKLKEENMQSLNDSLNDLNLSLSDVGDKRRLSDTVYNLSTKSVNEDRTTSDINNMAADIVDEKQADSGENNLDLIHVSAEQATNDVNSSAANNFDDGQACNELNNLDAISGRGEQMDSDVNNLASDILNKEQSNNNLNNLSAIAGTNEEEADSDVNNLKANLNDQQDTEESIATGLLESLSLNDK